MGVNQERDIPSQLVSAIEALVQPHGFSRHTHFRYEGKIKHSWIRQTGNVQHIVDCTYAVRRPTFVSMGLVIQVVSTEGSTVIAGTPLANLHDKKVFYDFPVFFRSLRTPRFIRGVASDLNSSLGWFDPFTRERCLEMLLSGEAGIKRQAPIFPHLVLSLGGTVEDKR